MSSTARLDSSSAIVWEKLGMHPNAGIAALGIGCRDMIDIGIAFDPRLASTDTLCRAVATLGAFRCRAVHLNQHRTINVGTERAFNGLQISLVAVTGKLDAVGEARGKIAVLWRKRHK
jgi:hypothetical protein